jgi:alginate O-acetyltransferase complex protein AlgI
MLDFDSFDYFENLLALSIVVVPLYYALKNATARCLLLGTTGLYLLLLIAPRLAVFYIGFWVLQLALQRAVRAWPNDDTRWIALSAASVATLAPMVLWKVAPTLFIVDFNLRLNQLVAGGSSWFGAVDRARNIILPIGLSFATFRAIDVLVKIHLELVNPLRVSRLFAFGFFPPVQMIGPVIEVTEIDDELDLASPPQPRLLLGGAIMIGLGLVKVFGISFVLEPSGAVFNANAVGSAWEFWFELFRFTLYFYFNFSGFTDIAVGIALLFGFEIQGNFNNPYLKTNPQDFWNSWHMSLTRFCQRNVFVPLGGMRSSRQYVAILATIMVIALWHDISIPLVLFGIYHGAGLVGHRYLVSRRPPKRGVALRALKVPLLYVYFSLSLPLLLLPLNQLGGFYENLVGRGGAP